MTHLKSYGQEWIESVERALATQVESVTAKRFHPPPLSNVRYRALGEQANHDANARAVFDQYFPELNAALSDLVNLLSEHPVIRENSTGTGTNMATYVTMPSKGFRLELGILARNLTHSAVRRGCREAAASIARLLELSAGNEVPGYQVYIFRGLTLSGEVEIMPGLEIISYRRAVNRGLVEEEPLRPEDPPPDYVGMGALVLAREMTWGPCIVPPNSPKDIYSWERTPQFRCLPRDSSGVVFNLLSIITSHRIQPLSALYCAPEFVDVSRGFGSGPLQLFRIDDSWPTEEFTPKHLSELQEQLQAWPGFDRGRRKTLEFAVRRLASSIQRDRGRFLAEDRILDAAIALEVLYAGSSEVRATRAGHFLADETDERITVLGQMRAFLKVRNSIVHADRGRIRPDGNALKAAADSGFDLAYGTVKKLLARGEFPNWDKLVMS